MYTCVNTLHQLILMVNDKNIFAVSDYRIFIHLPYRVVYLSLHNLRSAISVFAPSAGAVEYTDCTSAKGSDPTPKECPRYDKKSYGKVPVMLEIWGIQSSQEPLWPGVVKPNRVLSLGQIELNSILMLKWTVWNRTVFDNETVLRLNWIVWKRTVLTFNCVWTKLYLY